ncbi:MAG: radical SAM protein [Chloroflexi bacterium]|nr:radical SAM protein [Chloroflexota bacterium]
MRWQSIAAARRVLAQEKGAVIKDWGGRLSVALCYPNSYHVGMSNLAVHTLYRLFNQRGDVVCERVFSGLGRRERENDPPVSIESQRPLSDFDVIAFSVSYELDYFHLVGMLRRAGIPTLARERDADWPLVLAGGPAPSANPAPLAPICDALFIGEVEERLPGLLDVLTARGVTREDILATLATQPGLYVPALATEGTRVTRQWLRDLDSCPTHSVVFTPHTEFGDMFLLEISRGCGRGCRFCLAGYTYRPPRARHLDTLLQSARDGLTHRKRIGLVGAAVSDHPAVDRLAVTLRGMGAGLGASSLRADSVSEVFLRCLAEGDTRTLTLAPEVGSERLRRVINKNIPEDKVIRAVRLAAGFHFEAVKLYFMVGLPGESEEDVDEITTLVREVTSIFPGLVKVNITPFVPKPGTPFQWAAMAPAEVLTARTERLKRALASAQVEVTQESVPWARVQGVLARGDQRVGEALALVASASLGAWNAALRKAGLAEEEYLDERPLGAPLPWQIVETGVETEYLVQEWRAALDGKGSPECQPGGCETCGVCRAVFVTERER